MAQAEDCSEESASSYSEAEVDKKLMKQYEEVTKIITSFVSVVEKHRLKDYQATSDWVPIRASEERMIGLMKDVSEQVYGLNNSIGVSNLMEKYLAPYFESLEDYSDRIPALYHVVLVRLDPRGRNPDKLSGLWEDLACETLFELEFKPDAF